jgi:hypothetical protein
MRVWSIRGIRRWTDMSERLVGGGMEVDNAMRIENGVGRERGME